MLLVVACDKNDFLADKPRSSLIVPNTLDDFTKLLDNFNVMNVSGSGMSMVAAEDFYLPNLKIWQSISAVEVRNSYAWLPDLYEGKEIIRDWNEPYVQILYANVVLEGLEKFTGQQGWDWRWLKGWALFARGNALYNLAQQFSATYDPERATELLGVPIRLEADVTSKSVRSSQKETYERIIADLVDAEALLPDTKPSSYKNRPYRSAANALLARVYLQMGDCERALHYADRSLDLYGELIDFNMLDVNAVTPIVQDNPEILYSCYSASVAPSVLGTYRIAPSTLIDSALYRLYKDSDLRKSIFFTISTTYNKPVFKGSYSGNTREFTGLATDEQYLIKAECEIRIGQYQKGLQTLDELLSKRISGVYTPLYANNKDSALKIVLEERRKELVFRGRRWEDIRRLNREGEGIELIRVLEGETWRLQPNSKRYTLPIPQNEIILNGLVQNERQ